ncbi:UBC2 [Hepatospora eriocheir]|uniref:UBC2 n=1 Tax=Hepatospora eriocheir TaxID=1081669 RepID=A0A1X0Q736_9MICR|nr:UBC2 [Hepatospora eriocheir]ORD99965.1 UBC2 [Hepatospora eriocheir]
MATSPTRRLLKDLEVVNNNCETHKIYAEPLESDVFTWVAIISGPSDTPYEGGSFSLAMIFDETYPQNAPEVCFLCPMFHPNVYNNGDLCLDILKNKWSPTYDVLGILLSIQSLLNDPNINSPANVEAANLYENDPNQYHLRVRDIVEKSWDINEIGKKKKTT